MQGVDINHKLPGGGAEGAQGFTGDVSVDI